MSGAVTMSYLYREDNDEEILQMRCGMSSLYEGAGKDALGGQHPRERSGCDTMRNSKQLHWKDGLWLGRCR